jgi:hypothetical protein
MNLNQRFGALDENLKLDPDQRKRAEEAHNRLGDILVKAGVAKRTRLQGSFARKTMRPPLKDVDKVVELVDSLQDTLSGSDGPHRAMILLRDTLTPELPGASFEMKKHALAILLPDEGFDFDAVPAFNPEDGTGWIVIADTDDRDWEPSNTYVLIDVVSERNKVCEGRFVRQVRMVKEALHHAGISASLPGLHVEAFAYATITCVMEHPAAVAAVLDEGAELMGGAYSDPTGADQISHRLDPAVVPVTKSLLASLAQRAGEALKLAAAGDEVAAAHIWADLFGNKFPRPDAAEEKSYLRGLHTGAAVAGTALGATPTRAWRPV